MTLGEFTNMLKDIGGWYFVIFTFAYGAYTIIRACYYFNDGIKNILLGYRQRDVRLYHIIWGIVDIPAIICGRIYHVIARIFSIKVFTLKEKKDN